MEQASGKLLKTVEQLSIAKSVAVFGLIALGFATLCLSGKYLTGGVRVGFAIASLATGILCPILVCNGCDMAMKYLRNEEEKKS